MKTGKKKYWTVMVLAGVVLVAVFMGSRVALTSDSDHAHNADGSHSDAHGGDDAAHAHDDDAEHAHNADGSHPDDHDDDEGHAHNADGSHPDAHGDDEAAHDHGDDAAHEHGEEEGHAHNADGSHPDDHDDDAAHDHGDDEAAHDHGEEDAHEHGEEEGHDHGEEDAQEHGDAPVVELSEGDIAKFGIEVEKVGAGKFGIGVSVPGEITFNENKLAHIVPTVPGIVREVLKQVGDNVVAGEVIAWLESTELGGAKVAYLTTLSEAGCCKVELERAQEVYDNTLKLLKTLKGSPSLESLQEMGGSAMGMNRSLLISAYAELIFAKETYLREKGLYEKKISSTDDFLKADSAFKKADAQYGAMRDSVDFEVRLDLLEAKQSQRVLEIELQAAERLLYVLGLTDEDVKDLASLAGNQNPQVQEEHEEHECNDPNCTGCAADSAPEGYVPSVTDLRMANEKLAWYPIRSPFDGIVIEKHLALGEVVGDDTEVLVIADLSTVWVDLQILPKDIGLLKEGQRVSITAKSSASVTDGLIDYVGPVIDEQTRTALARVVLDNASRQLRPGTFITAEVLVDSRDAEVVISKSTLQDVDDTTCVFVKDDHGFECRPVTVGRSNDEYVEIVAGLKPGETIATKNSFRLKAELKKAAGGGHAGHGHAH